MIQIDDLKVPHVYGTTRGDVHFGAGYASGYSRLFQMDVLRHTARGKLTELAGAGSGNANLEMDVDQLRVADYTEAELQRMIDTAAAAAGEEGAEMKQDLLDYVDGVNAFIAEAAARPAAEPAEYAALGVQLEDWKPTDTRRDRVADRRHLRQGRRVRDARRRRRCAAARRASARRRGARVFKDFRSLNDPEAPVTTPAPLPLPRSRAAGKGKGVALPDAGSPCEDYDPVVGGAPATRRARAARRAAASEAAPLRAGSSLGGPASNATLVRAADSESGRPLGVTGPQVAYYSPEILFEIDLHGGGVDARGVAFPGISLYVLLGRGKDSRWSATTATTDNVDEFVEELCEPDGSARSPWTTKDSCERANRPPPMARLTLIRYRNRWPRAARAFSPSVTCGPDRSNESLRPWARVPS